MAGLRLKDIFGGRAGDERGVEGEIRRVVLGVACVDYRLRALAPAIDRHADRLCGAHRARAALGVAA
jgi:hypothetical protein